MSKLQADTTHEEREQITDEAMAALAETGCRKGEPWWQVYFLVAILGRAGAALLVADALRAHAGAGMLVRDWSRKRTLGGVFFQLARERAGRKGWRRVVTLAAYTWARRWLRKLAEKGVKPTNPDDLRAALRAHGDVASARGERIFFELAAKQAAGKADPVREVLASEGTDANLCQTNATSPKSRAALAGVLKAAAAHVSAHPERFRPKTEPPAPPRRAQGRGGPRRPSPTPPVEVIQRPRRGP